MIIYVVREGDTVTGIAAATGSSVERVLRDNGLAAESVLVPGQALVILQPNITHTVAEGDTLLGIAERYGVSPKELLANNPSLNGREFLYPGEALVIDYVTNTERRELAVNGYAYPYIDREILRKTLPYLTYITMFTYGFTENGDLIGIDDEEVIRIAKQYQVAPLMLLSTLTEGGTFSNELASRIFENAEARNRLFDQILENLRVKGYYGLDVDFEFVLPRDKENYVQFLTELKARLEPEGYPLFTALAPKTSGEQEGLLYEAHDYPAIGEIADYILLMTYEWGYTQPHASNRQL
ncbi:MAG: LysM peptidoglycan-binding domain-containing protein [Lachnospiraceae bacterium]|nr:LysM peptidoglycan-binding domain-containing protein [Lachnospiraceae bacterium]